MIIKTIIIIISKTLKTINFLIIDLTKDVPWETSKAAGCSLLKIGSTKAFSGNFLKLALQLC